MGIATINPATGETLRSFESLSDADVKNAISLADKAFKDYRQTSFEQRAEWMHKAADILEKDKAKFAELMTLEMGKPYKSAMAEVG